MRQRVLGEALQIIPQTVEVPREMPEQAPNGGHGAQHGEALRGEMIVQDLAQHPIRRGFLAIVDFRYPPASLRWGAAPLSEVGFLKVVIMPIWLPSCISRSLLLPT